MSECIHCHKCRENCSFLKKYGLDIGDTEQLEKLAYHCFLCGKCTQVCPKGIDGRQLILSIRQNQVESNGGKLIEKGYGMLLKEKQNYIFKNYRNATTECVLFPGCNFPSFYPETTKKLIQVLRQEAEIGVVFDCCSKPIAELGLEERTKEAVERMEQRLQQAGIKEIVLVCPNCYYFLKSRLQIRVTSIYEKLKELQIGKILKGDISIFMPCPDRKEGAWLEWIQPFVEGKINPVEESQCCGLGGCAGRKEPELAKEMAQMLLEHGYEKIHTYCASCSGNLTRNGHGQAVHILTEILGNIETADVDKSIVNRMKTKYW